MGFKPALVVVDVQNDFLPGGALGVSGGDQIVPVLNRYVQLFADASLPVFATRDWHPRHTTHFAELGGPWPVHCVEGTHGAAFAPELSLPPDVMVVSKGMDPSYNGYSCFDAFDSTGMPFEDLLRRLGLDHLYVGGLATDYCVRYTALDALKKGVQVSVLEDAVRGVDTAEAQQALQQVMAAGGRLVNLEKVRQEVRTFTD